MSDDRHFGKRIIAKRTGMDEEDPRVEILWLRLYKVCPAYVNGAKLTSRQ